MTKVEFLKSLDFETAKSAVTKKLGIKPESVTVKTNKNGEFEINLKKAEGSGSYILAGAKKAIICTLNLEVNEAVDKENKPTGEFSYMADILVVISNANAEYISTIGKVKLNRNKFIFSTTSEIKAAEKTVAEKAKAAKEAAKLKKEEAKLKNEIKNLTKKTKIKSTATEVVAQ